MIHKSVQYLYYLQFCSKRGAYLFVSLWQRRHTLINEVDANTPPPPLHEMDAMPRLQGYIYISLFTC